jgi:hypothetical protein
MQERNILLVLGCCVLVTLWVFSMKMMLTVDGLVKVGDNVEVLTRGEHFFTDK